MQALFLNLCRFLILLYLEVKISRFSHKQNSGCGCRQAFIHYCQLHQVLMKSTLVNESLSTTTTRVLFLRESTYFYFKLFLTLLWSLFLLLLLRTWVLYIFIFRWAWIVKIFCSINSQSSLVGNFLIIALVVC